MLRYFNEPGADAAPDDAYLNEQLSAFRRSAQPPWTDVAALEADFSETRLPSRGTAVRDYLGFLFERVVSRSVKTHSRRFIGHMTSALPSFVEPLGRIMTTLNQNVVKLETSNAFTFYERQALAMIHRLVYGEREEFYREHVQRRDSTLGMIVSGGTLANVAALWCARNGALRPEQGLAGVESEGLVAALQARGYRRAVVVGSSLMHYSLEKAVDLLGLGRNALLKVDAQADGTVDLAALRQTLRRCKDDGALVVALVGIAGTTETGAVDPLEQMADLSAEHGCHLHVDAAWGGPVLFSTKYHERLAGIGRADSVTVDGHKQLYLPMGLGMVLLRDPRLAHAIETTARYIVRAGSLDLGRRTLEGSRPAMAIFLHGALHIIGRAGYAALVDDGIEKTRFMADTIAARPDFELLANPTLNILVYRWIPPAHRDAVRRAEVSPAVNELLNDVNRRLQERQRDRGWSFISRTTLANTRHGAMPPIVCLRAVLANPLTAREDIVAVLDEQTELAASL